MIDSNGLADIFERATEVRWYDDGSRFIPEFGSSMSDEARLHVISVLRSAASPVVYQHRCMKDWWHSDHAEWCDWHNISKARYEKTLVEIAAGKTRIQVRALCEFAATPVAPHGD